MNLARPNPDVPIKKFVGNDYTICFGDGAKLEMLKRNIRTLFT